MTQFAELPESNATGEIARIYAEIRDTYTTPYVSSLQRHLATHPGVLEWAWDIVGPGFHSGIIPETAWRIARDTDHDNPLQPIGHDEWFAMGVDVNALASIRNVCENFVRVAPLNLLFAGCIRSVIEGARLPAQTTGDNHSWSKPPELDAMPSMVDPATTSREQRDTLLTLSSRMGEQQFIPGLYRILANWPRYLEHVSREISPRLSDPGFRARGKQLASRINAAVPAILERIGQRSALPAPNPRLQLALLEATLTYRRTSPEMVLVGTLLLNQLPERLTAED